jgi:C-terminal processing protease CtpA/Prc
MHMNKRNIWIALSLGALAIALAALPGHSAKLQSADQCAKQIVQAKVRVIEDIAQQASQRVANAEEAWANVQEIEKIEGPGDENVEVYIGGGSWLGVETNEVTAEKVKQLKLPAERGVLVGKIVPESPAAKAGLKENDVITELNGQRIEGIAQFRRMIREIPIGRTAQLTIVRDGRGQSVSVTLGSQESPHMGGMMRSPTPGTFAFRVPETPELPEIAELGELNALGVASLGQPRLGIDAEDLQGDLGNYFGAPDGEGVLVRSVFSDSPAGKAGIKAGDVITSVNGKRIRRVRELREEMKAAGDEKPLKVGLLRNKGELSMDVQLPARVKKEIHMRSERTNL